MLKPLSTILLIGLTAGQVFAATPKEAVCSVSEILASGQSKSTTWRFDGSEQENELLTTLLSGIVVKVRATPGSIGDYQSFVLMSTLTDTENNVATTSQGWFTNNKKYSEKFKSVIRGTLLVRLRRANQDKVEVSCYNPQHGGK